jgi:6-phosphofructokinase
MRIAVLTGGGDVPGLNPAIKAIVNRAIDNNFQVVASDEGGKDWCNITSRTRQQRMGSAA